MWRKAEGKMGKVWFSLTILHLANLICDPLTLKIASVTAIIHPSPLSPANNTLTHLLKHLWCKNLQICTKCLFSYFLLQFSYNNR